MIVVSLLLILLSGGMLFTGILDTNDGLVLASIGVSVFAAAALFLGIRQQRAQNAPASAEDGSSEPAAAETDVAVRVSTGRFSARRVSGREASRAGDADAADDTADDPAEEPDAPALQASDPEPGADARGRFATSIDVSGPDRDATAAGDGAGARAADEAGEAGQAGEAADPGDPDHLEDIEDLDDLEDLEDPADEPPAELLLASEEDTLSHRDDEVLVVDGRPRYHLTGCPHLADKSSEPLPVAEAVELGFTPCSRCAVATTLLGAVSS
ncbi:MAG TPA: hypothetical protein VGR21_02555 [Cryptosporangiaceae bacterium]|nr:hypothetical protein [Cryptosporangiaceae bacterium]